MQDLDRLPARELERWYRYWIEEPWGPYRDNMHAALIAIEMRRPQLPEGSRSPSIADFMLEHVEDQKARQNAKMIALLETNAIKAERAERRRKGTKK
ncbi:MAG TPA: hypothetical protein VNG73_11510 [Gemmatimonadaceae bacterium]|nr:hypothetical protein [Gemmatimonadaceae bacterium]